MSQYALVNESTNYVDNVIELRDELVGVIPFPGYRLVKMIDDYASIGIGWFWNGSNFDPPVYPDSDPEPEGET